MNFIEEIIEDGSKENLQFRFPPEPNGYLHLGHAKAICLNFGLAEKYKVGCNLRFDDTNPLAEDSIFTDAIEADIKWLGFEYGKPLYTSDYFTFLNECAENLIMADKAYMDDSTSEEIREMKGDLENGGQDSPYRTRSIQENLDLFNKMCKGEGDSVLRAKIDMQHQNILMRDPVIYRRIDATHHNTGNTWKAYPMYDFAHPLSDWYEKISHSLCTLEFKEHRPFYEWLLNTLELEQPHPRQIEFSRLNIEGVKLSKRHLKELVDEGVVDGWDDPRMPTLSGLRRRGFTPDSIKNFCAKVGITKRESEIERHLLEECLREELNEKSMRQMVVLDPLKLTIKNLHEFGKVIIENNPGNSDDGSRLLNYTNEFWIERADFREEANRKYHRLKIGGEVRLKGLFVVKAVDCVKDKAGNIVEVIAEYDPKSFSGMELDRKVKGTIHWVNMNECDEILIHNFNGYKKTSTMAYGEPFVRLTKDYPVQFMRNGYYIRVEDEELSFNHTVSLKSSYKG